MSRFVMKTLLGYFKTEISNNVQEKNGKLIIELADGKKVKIRFIDLV